MGALADIYTCNPFVLSYGLFPPKTEKGMVHLLDHVADLMAFGPAFVTCTYGAGGSTQKKTLETLDRVRESFCVPVASHLTCVGASADELRAYLTEADKRGVSHIVAIRGDAPQGADGFRAAPGGFSHANELASLIREEFPQFGVAVAGYPEIHVEAPSPEADLDNLKRKVDAGADIVITQLFFNNDDFFRFRDRCAAAGISVPIVPGILPVTNLKQVQRITSLCGAKLAPELVARLEAHGDDEVGQFAVGVYYATRQVEALIEAGVPGIHFYVLNKSHATALICRALTLPRRAAKPRQVRFVLAERFLALD